ncbi:murein biosynthesis integral membrane protein MurJ [Gloeocapsa sp. PCC 73106]|uniref:murein biosynthesis integral membrane protein MurJ n=1 Tax=Gloeocapsa sp. PCC 73106 TaxID=102232 RepID=UPI0002AD0E81|nr:murein biosynthesis integral membrane protein MurJ [Gloeocapsa sp. PCC 73106]ELR99580.1 integral membrane protein MviN [Gloeocapsa sp. PCC 73106]
MVKKSSRSFAGIAGIVALATLISKVFGLVREQLVAAAFGIGPIVNAYAYAYVVPGFLLILLGGINGPFHSALVSVLAKTERSKAAPLVETVTTLVSVILLLVSVFLLIFAPIFIDLLAPGLSPSVREMAIQQLRIMSPLALLGGLIGIGFGTLNAADQYWLPSISPLFSSVAIVLGVIGLIWQLGEQINAPEYLQLGSIILAGGTVVGAILQWLAQLIAQSRSGMGKFRLSFDWRIPGVRDVLKVMIPATLSSGMLHINVYTDLFFASYLEGAAAAMRYANFIVLTPLGIISNMILVPLLPKLSRLSAPESREELKLRIRQGLILTALTMLPLSAIFVALALPIVQLVYQRYAFQADASLLVAPVLTVYGLGMFFYLGRDVLVRVFYALGDGETPFRISLINIVLNAVLNFFLIKVFGIPGLVLATVGVNIFSMILFLLILDRRLQGLPLKSWLATIVALFGATFVAGSGSWFCNWGLQSLWGDQGWFILLLNITLSTSVAVVLFGAIALQLKLPELEILLRQLKQKFKL